MTTSAPLANSRETSDPVPAANNRTRLQAFLIHLSISVVVLLALLAIIFFIWFPHDFIQVGGTQGLIIVAGVDLIMGPLLTLVIFNPKKKPILIRLDLCCIALAQAACMAYGLTLVYQQRPLLQVLADDGVYTYTAAELANYGIDIEALALPDSAPHHVVLDLPDDRKAINQLKLIQGIVSGRPFAMSQEFYVPGSTAGTEKIDQRLAYIESGMNGTEVAFIESLAGKENCHWLPIHSVHANGAACYSAQEGVTHIARQ